MAKMLFLKGYKLTNLKYHQGEASVTGQFSQLLAKALLNSNITPPSISLWFANKITVFADLQSFVVSCESEDKLLMTPLISSSLSYTEKLHNTNT